MALPLKDITNAVRKENPRLEIKQEKFKTELCKNWIETGSCNYGSKCRFAHGEAEIIQKNNTNVKYKSKLCVSFHTQMFCPYGNRCLFKHDERSVKDIFKGFYKFLVRYPELRPVAGKKAPRLPIFFELAKGISKNNSQKVPKKGIVKFVVKRSVANAEYYA